MFPFSFYDIEKGKGICEMNKKIIGGVLLLAAAVVLLVSQLGYLPGEFFLLVLGGGFCLTYFLMGGAKEYGSVGFLIPGAILLALGGYALAEGALSGAAVNEALFFAALSAAFLIVLIHTVRFKDKDHGGRFWPVYPAGALLVLSGIIYGSNFISIDISADIFNYIWVAVLIVVGIRLLFTGRDKVEGKN